MAPVIKSIKEEVQNIYKNFLHICCEKETFIIHAQQKFVNVWS